MMTTLIGFMKLYLKAFLMLCLSLVKNILSLLHTSGQMELMSWKLPNMNFFRQSKSIKIMIR